MTEEEQKKFLEAYQNKLAYDEGAGYGEWLSTYGTDANRQHQEARAAAERTYESQKGTLGALGEIVGSRGLAGSGYADYLKERAAVQKQAALQKAAQTFQETQKKNQKGYASYVAAKAKQSEQVLKTLVSQGVGDEKAAYNYALAMGIEPTAAEVVATLAGQWKGEANVSDQESSLRFRIILQATKSYLPPDATYQYALGCGLSEEVSREIANAVKEALDHRYDYRYYRK